MNAVEYVEILDQILLPSIKAIFGNDQGNLLEVVNVIKDNSGVHTATIVKQLYEKQPFVNRLNLPARSPELNIIENVWAEMVRLWKTSMAKTHSELMTRVDEAWGELRTNDGQLYLQTLADSMHRRLQKIIDAGEACIHY